MEDAEARITRLEERFTHLHKHVTEQDRVILDLGEQIDRLRKELVRLRAVASMAEPRSADEQPADERPPHY